MNLSNITFFSALAVLFGLTAVSSCSDSEKYAGQWQGTPERIYTVEGASDATATVTMDFAPSVAKKSPGAVMLSAVVEVQQPMSHFCGFEEAYQSNIVATASITGTYTTKDDDDVVLTLDPSTMSVMVDPATVTFSQNIISGIERPILDSLTNATADYWRVAITPAIREIFNKYHRIEDIKVHHTDILSCEIENRDYTFRRVGVPD